MEGKPLYHLVASDLWQAAKASGQPYFPPTYSQEGFIHLTSDPAFLLKIGNLFYRDSPHQQWLLLVLDSSKLTAKVVFEPAAPVGDKSPANLTEEGGEAPPLFPHLYGTIDYESVVSEVEVERGSDGTFLSIPGY